jgi:hypothetical protein
MEEREISRDEVLGWAEFACWTVVVLTPFLWWVNGPAVSSDQLVVRTALTVLALVGGVSLRIAKWVRGKRKP